MRPAQVSRAVRAEAQRLEGLPPRALVRIAIDLIAWALLGWAAMSVHPIFVLPIAFVIGFVPMHDLLIHGHEAVHGLASRSRFTNELLLWFLHALFGISGTAHRVFHLGHHRWPHEERDPEYAVLERLGGARGLSYLFLPWIAPLGVYLWVFTRRQPRGVRARVVAESTAMALLHLGLVLALGPIPWIVCVALPIGAGLLPAFTVRAIGEHHGAISGHPWKYAGTLDGGILGRLWSNIDHHLEHHLFPRVPTRYMPELRAALRADYAREGVSIGPGWWKTFFTLVKKREHFGDAAES